LRNADRTQRCGAKDGANEAILWAPAAQFTGICADHSRSRRLEATREIDQRGKADFGVFGSD
jgi:hypothetical protein